MSRTKIAWLVSLVSGVVLFSGRASAADPALFDEVADRQAIDSVVALPFRPICSESTVPGFKHCFAKIVTGDDGIVVPSVTPGGFGPPDIQSAYGLPTTGGNGKLIAAVDAYDYPNAEADLAVYRTQYGLPPCTTANGCFKKVDENGGNNLPGLDPAGGCTNGWSGETSLDLQMLSATCPDCHILLVEANAPDQSLQTAVNTAAKLGALAISNSYGGPESASDKKSESVYTHPGILITASAGDQGFIAEYPATSAGVVAVGGTTLKKSASTRGWAETAWKGGGSGCSAEIAKPAWQNDATCKTRMESDVSAVGNPSTGVAVYCSDPGVAGNWVVVGGTSVSAPLIAGAFTIMNVSTSPSFAWMNPSLFFDVTSGTNGTCPTGYFCTAGTGYDGPTGWGTPNGALLQKHSGGGAADAGVDAGEAMDSGVSAAKDAGMDAEAPREDGGGTTTGTGSGGSSGGSGSSGGAGMDSGSGVAPVLAEDAGLVYGSSGSGSSNGTSSPGAGGDSGTSSTSGGCTMGAEPTGDALTLGLGIVLVLGARRRRARG